MGDKVVILRELLESHVTSGTDNERQTTLFNENLAEQFRPYYISKNTTAAVFYKSVSDSGTTPADTTRVDFTDSSNTGQTTYFNENLAEQFRPYYISKNTTAAVFYEIVSSAPQGDFMMRVDGTNVQTKIPADHTLVGFLASFTGSNISYNTSSLNQVFSGNHKVSHAVATDEGLQGTGDWQTVFTLSSTSTLDTSATANSITGTPETHLAVVADSAPHTILTKHTGNSSDFF